MGLLIDEVRLWNTPLVGAFLLWNFTKGYCDNHPGGDAPVGLLHFIAFAILTNNKLIKPVSNQRDDLQSYVRSFQNKHEIDLLLSIHSRILDKREDTLRSIDVAVAEGLLVWDFDSGKLYSRDLERKPKRGSVIFVEVVSIRMPILNFRKYHLLLKYTKKNPIASLKSLLHFRERRKV